MFHWTTHRLWRRGLAIVVWLLMALTLIAPVGDFMGGGLGRMVDEGAHDWLDGVSGVYFLLAGLMNNPPAALAAWMALLLTWAGVRSLRRNRQDEVVLYSAGAMA